MSARLAAKAARARWRASRGVPASPVAGGVASTDLFRNILESQREVVRYTTSGGRIVTSYIDSVEGLRGPKRRSLVPPPSVGPEPTSIRPKDSSAVAGWSRLDKAEPTEAP